MSIRSLASNTSNASHSSNNSGAALRPAKFSALFLALLGLVMSGITLSSDEASAAQVLNYEDQPITASLTAAEVKKGIMKAGAGRGWKMKESGPGELTAMIHVRTHTATITISYSAKSYSIMYKDSTNLKYKNGKIHRNYNNWVKFLKDDIDLELSF
jgi:hypothetical protein